MNYSDVVNILKISQDRVARDERFETFKRAMAFHGVTPACEGARPGEGVILVAGTNGKGTVSATLAKLLGVSHRGVGLFTSPHLIEPTERIAVDGHPISKSEMVAAYLAIEPAVTQFDLSHFEILTLMMIEVFFGGRLRPRVARAVIEVGVGGRLDPTRALPHDTAVLARIGLDHEAILGSTLPAIAREKLAIVEGASRFVFMKPDAVLEPVFAEARQRSPQTQWIESQSYPSEVTSSELIPQWRVRTPWGDAPLSLMGERAVQNTSLALDVMKSLGEPIDLSELAHVEWPGRMERVKLEGRDVFLSGDHNEQGVESLCEILAHFRYEKLWLVVGIGKGKPVDQMLGIYRRIERAKLILTKTNFRQIEAETFSKLESEHKFEDAFTALKFAVDQAGPRDLVVVSGSLYLVGDLRARLLAR